MTLKASVCWIMCFIKRKAKYSFLWEGTVRMKNYLKNMEMRLSAEEKKLLKLIYEPTVVTIPPSDACRSMCVTSDGEIRIYGSINKNSPDEAGTLVYISSTDCGLSWKTHLMENDMLGSAGYNFKTGRYISCYPDEVRADLKESFGKSGTWAIINDEGYDGTNNRFIKLSDKFVHVMKLPFFLESCNRWFIIGEHRYADMSKNIVIFYSDDDGESWTENVIDKTAPMFEIKPPHKDVRWQEYSCEPTIAELSDGELIMLVRTSQNYHYIYRSDDKGKTWSEPLPSAFHGTITMPVLHKLSDGRIVLFWCNNQPMPELEHEKAFPPLDNATKKGIWEDVFTNRDANHLAISEDDGKTWTGFRELFLNTIRNNADFRAIGGVNSRDKSVHQAQILELPYNKLLVHFGQNSISRKAVILDIDWLYEKERFEDFRLGLCNVSTHMYVKSNLGGYRGFSGHCAYNRTNGALLIPDPDGNFEEALQICRIEDDRLVYKKQGVVWNFPASQKGRVEIKLRVINSGVAISLTDHWYNPCDETVKYESPLSFEYKEVSSKWDIITIEYDTEEMTGNIFVNNELLQKVKLEAANGLCYLHIQTLAEYEDFEGTLIKTFRKTMI